MSLPDGVHTFPFEMEFDEQAMTLYPSAIEIENGLILLDTGMPHTIDGILEGIREVGFVPEEIRMVLLTHQDGDHAGGLSTVIEAADPTVLAHEIAAPVIDGRKAPRVEAGPERYPPACVDVELGGEATINTSLGPARVIETPGHTPGHVSIYLPDEKLLIAGDALGLYGDRLDKPQPEVTMDQETAIDSIDALSALEIDRVLCYHGGPTGQGSARLEEIVAEGY